MRTGKVLMLLAINCLCCTVCASLPESNKNSTYVEQQVAQLKTKFLPEELSITNFTLDDAKQMLRQKCKKAALVTGTKWDPQIYENIEEAAMHLMECTNSIGNLTAVLAEIEAARPLGTLDTVFQKYCKQRPHAEQCLHNFNTNLLPCLTPEERIQNEVVIRIVISLLKFICYKDGDQIALFIAEEGPECLDTHREDINNCMNATFSAYMPKILSNMTELPELVMSPKQCIDLYDFEECVLGYLEQCNEITPANIVEAMFKYVKNETKCQPEIDKNINLRKLKQTELNGGIVPAVPAISIFFTIIVGLQLYDKKILSI